jgi:hypothetical protein
MTWLRMLIDAVLALGLVGALCFVFAADSKRPHGRSGDASLTITVEEERVGSPRDEDRQEAVEVRPEPSAPVVNARPLRLAVTTGGIAEFDYDRMGRLLDLLGEGYRYETVPLEALERPSLFDRFDIIFLTCSICPRHWFSSERPPRPGIRPNTQEPDLDPRMMALVGRNFRDFLAAGGTLYVSDQHWEVLVGTFPEFFPGITVTTPRRGSQQVLTANVDDEGLRGLLGPTTRIWFDQPGWYPSSMSGQDVRNMLSASYQDLQGRPAAGTLLSRASVGQGTLIYTSFHMERQDEDASEKDLGLLKHLVFATVTAREASEVARTLADEGFKSRKTTSGGFEAPTKKTRVSGQFDKQGSSLLTTSDLPEITQTHRTTKRGPLRFVLQFRNEGAHLRLNVVGPDRRKRSKEGTSTLTIDVRDAPEGEWTYTVTALKLPYPAFPFTLTVGER